MKFEFQIVRLKESVSESGTELLRLLLYTVTSSGLCNHVAQLGKCLEQILSQRFLQRHILSEVVQAKNLVKSNKSKIFFKLNCISGSFKLFPSSKIDFWPFLKLQKIDFGQKIFSWNWFIWFHEIFWPVLFKNFWPSVRPIRSLLETYKA